MSFRAHRPGRAAGVALVAVSAVLALAGCTGSSPSPVASSASPVARSSAAPTTSASPEPVPSFDADASTSAALAEFTAVVKKRLASDPQPHGRDVVDALVAAGFDKKAMQVTPDETTLDRSVDSIEFSVLWKKQDCLIGQVGSAGFSSTSAPVLGTGTCLIGTTRTIDW